MSLQNAHAREVGVRRAAQRKLRHELGIRPAQVPLDGFLYLTRIHYLAPSDGQWGEHESKRLQLTNSRSRRLMSMLAVDYVLFATADVDLDVNANEVSDTRYVSKAELEALFQDPGQSSPLTRLARRAETVLSAHVHTLVQAHRPIVLVQMVGRAVVAIQSHGLA